MHACCRAAQIAHLSPPPRPARLENNQLAEVEEFEHQQKELEGVCNPIISAMYGAGGEGGMPGGGMPGGAGGAGSGPTVEEVD